MLVESSRPLSESFIWHLQTEYYRSMGIDAWLSGMIPSRVTTNSRIALEYARLIAAYMNDRGASEFEIVELGAGHGRFGFYCATSLQQMTDNGLLPGITWRYTLTDVAERNVDFMSAHHSFRDLVDKKRVDFAVFDAGCDTEISLRFSNESIGSNTPAKNLIVIANYFFDSLPIDVWQINGGQTIPCWTEVHVDDNAQTTSTSDPEILKSISLQWGASEGSSTYSDETNARRLSDMAQAVGNGTITMPIGGYRVLDTLSTWTNEPMMMLVTDKGYPAIKDYAGRKLPTIIQHGCFSFNLNFPALSHWFEDHQGYSLMPERGDGYTETAVYVSRMSARQTPRLFSAFDQLEQFNPAEYYEVIRRCERAKPRLLTCLGLLKLSAYDPQVFYQLRRLIRSNLGNSSSLQRSQLRAALRKIRRNYFPIEADIDNPFAIALVHQHLGDYAEAIECYNESILIHGEACRTFVNQAMCFRKLGQNDQSIELLMQALKLDPKDEEASELLRKYGQSDQATTNANSNNSPECVPDCEYADSGSLDQRKLRNWLDDLQLDVAEIDYVTDHPWAQTFRVECSKHDVYYAKLLPPIQWPAIIGLEQLSNTFEKQIPNIKAIKAEQGMILYRDHEGKSLKERSGKRRLHELIPFYASMQAIAAGQPELLAAVQPANIKKVVADFLEFFDDKAPVGGKVNADHFLGTSECQSFRAALHDKLNALDQLWRSGESVPLTINHCDFREQNAAVRADGSFVLFDWDDCLVGPAGMSMHNCFSGCSIPCRLLLGLTPSDRMETMHIELLDLYVKSLVDAGYASEEQIRGALPAALCAGVMRYLMSYGKFPLESKSDRSVVAGIMRRRISDLLDLCEAISASIETPATSNKFTKSIFNAVPSVEEVSNKMSSFEEMTVSRAIDFFQNGKMLEAKRICMAGLDQSPLSHPLRNCLGDIAFAELDIESAVNQYQIAASLSKQSEKYQYRLAELVAIRNMLHRIDEPETLPTIALTPYDQNDKELYNAKVRLSAELFKTYGTLFLKGVFRQSYLDVLHGEFMQKLSPILNSGDTDGALRVGKGRYMMTTPVEGSFNSPELYASPFLLKLLPRLLGKEFVMGSFTTVASMPDAPDMRMHKDHPALFETDESVAQLPSFSVTVLVSLLGLTEELGTTRVVKGSHRVSSAAAAEMPYQDPYGEKGACLLMDYRLSHQGLANRSKQIRPVLSLVYGRPWFRDYANFKKQSRLEISVEDFLQIPDEHRRLFDWLFRLEESTCGR